jgi:hypothetical protein
VTITSISKQNFELESQQKEMEISDFSKYNNLVKILLEQEIIEDEGALIGNKI